ncbi:hypothetical protein HWI79_1678 [Cryptosporidium felis]|nr:hypothetical protein HWI79_1678 [Cryptosporidium felis]
MNCLKFTSRAKRKTLANENTRAPKLEERSGCDVKQKCETSKKKSDLLGKVKKSGEYAQETTVSNQDNQNHDKEYILWEGRELKRLKREYSEYNFFVKPSSEVNEKQTTSNT